MKMAIIMLHLILAAYAECLGGSNSGCRFQDALGDTPLHRAAAFGHAHVPGCPAAYMNSQCKLGAFLLDISVLPATSSYISVAECVTLKSLAVSRAPRSLFHKEAIMYIACFGHF